MAVHQVWRDQPSPGDRSRHRCRRPLRHLPRCAHHRGRPPAGSVAREAGRVTRPEITTPAALPEEASTEASLRPSRLDEFIGQEKVKESLQIAIDAAKQRGEPLDHALFFGPPGLGKTTLAILIARELGVSIRTSSGPVLEKPGDLVGSLTSLKARDVFFIDEIHRLRPVLE